MFVLFKSLLPKEVKFINPLSNSEKICLSTSILKGDTIGIGLEYIDKYLYKPFLTHNGKIVSAIQAERISRIKRQSIELKDDKTWIGKTWEQLDDWLKDKILKRIQ